ncbi:MFS transporter [Streptomyces sp. NPDC054956]
MASRTARRERRDALPAGTRVGSLREGLRGGGGRSVFYVLLALVAFDELESATLAVLAPDIRDTFGVDDGVMVFVGSAAGAFIVLGMVPLGWLADRMRRGRLLGWAGLGFAAMVAASGAAGNVFLFFLARFGAGVARSSTIPAGSTLIADTYPIAVRGRLAAAQGMGTRAAAVLSPLAAGSIAAWAGGDAGWRWAFLALSVPAGIAACAAFRLPEPPRGQHEMTAVLGEVVTGHRPGPVSTEAAFARLLSIRTLRTSVLAFAAMGFGMFTGPLLMNLFAADHYGADALERGSYATLGAVASLVALPLVGRRYDRLYQADPARALRLVGALLVPAALLLPVQYAMPSLLWFTVAGIPGAVLVTVSFTMVTPVLQSVAPYRLRGLGAALGGIYVFFVGATGGALLAALLQSAFGPRVAVLAVGVPATLVGGLLLMRGSAYIREDLERVGAELREERAERDRQTAEPGSVPLLQVSGVEFGYGPVRVLFGVELEVRRGEVLALLGTNGSGKSSLLRVVSGLGTPSGGVVRLAGTTITYASPEQRSRLGVVLMPGGKGVFGGLTVRQNMRAGAHLYRSDPADRDRRIERALGHVPAIARRGDATAGSLSGGLQQQLALAMALVHDIEVLLLDELTLGLSPAAAQEVLEVVRGLKADGVTMVIVEQSVDRALRVADRAVFLEKGRVRFTGPAESLRGREDLLRSVFLGGGEPAGTDPEQVPAGADPQPVPAGADPEPAAGGPVAGSGPGSPAGPDRPADGGHR